MGGEEEREDGRRGGEGGEEEREDRRRASRREINY